MIKLIKLVAFTFLKLYRASYWGTICSKYLKKHRFLHERFHMGLQCTFVLELFLPLMHRDCNARLTWYDYSIVNFITDVLCLYQHIWAWLASVTGHDYSCISFHIPSTLNPSLFSWNQPRCFQSRRELQNTLKIEWIPSHWQQIHTSYIRNHHPSAHRLIKY